MWVRLKCHLEKQWGWVSQSQCQGCPDPHPQAGSRRSLPRLAERDTVGGRAQQLSRRKPLERSWAPTHHGRAAVHHGAADLRRQVDAHVGAGGGELPVDGRVRHHPEGRRVGTGYAQGAAQGWAGDRGARGYAGPGGCPGSGSNPRPQG